MSSHMSHSVMVPDWVWEYWQEVTGRSKPASAIREEIIRITTNYQMQEKISRYEQHMDMIDSKGSLLPDPLPQDTVDFSVEDDVPTLITIERVGVCRFCKKIMKRGEEAFWFTAHGRKYTAHPECWEEDQEEIARRELTAAHTNTLG